MKVKIKKFNFQKELESNIDYLLEEQKVEVLEEIVAIMERKKISRAELARRMGTSRAYITKLLRMNINFTLESLVKIAHSIGSKISIHFHQPEAKPIWFDIYKEYRDTTLVGPNKPFMNREKFEKAENVKPKEVRNGQCAFAA
jgi:transcriptional regulator with XRE-family HTH domain